MELRKPFQGVWNIIRFNWHFYVVAFVVIFISFLIKGLCKYLLYAIYVAKIEKGNKIIIEERDIYKVS